jgi:hypothetical protein
MELCDVCLIAIATLGTQDVQREKERVISKSYCTECYHDAFLGKKGFPKNDKAHSDSRRSLPQV